MRVITFVSTGLFLVVSAFVMKKEHQASSLYDTKWSLKKIHTETGMQAVTTKAFIKFNQEKNSAGGNGSCNSFGSHITITGNTMSFKNIFSTKMYCEDVQQTEDNFLQGLGKITRFEMKENILLLYHGKELLLEFASE